MGWGAGPRAGDGGREGFEVKRERPACEGRSTVHVDNIHFEYANAAGGTQCCFHTDGYVVRLGLETKGATGHCEARMCAWCVRTRASTGAFAVFFSFLFSLLFFFPTPN